MTIEDTCWRFYWKAQGVIAPQLKYSQAIYEDVLCDSVSGDDIWLDLGCGHKLLPPWRKESEKKLCQVPKFITGLDYDSSSLYNHKGIKALVRGDISELPFKDESFSLITANMVFEHLSEPSSQLAEIRRVLKAGGRLIFHTPNLLWYSTLLSKLIPESIKPTLIYLLENRKEEDVYKTFYRINTEKHIKHLAQKSGFKIQKIRMIVSSVQFVKHLPLAVFELILLKIMMKSFARRFRSNIIAIIVKA